MGVLSVALSRDVVVSDTETVLPIAGTVKFAVVEVPTAFSPTIDVPERCKNWPSATAPIASRVGPPVSSIATTVGFGYVPPRSPPAAPFGGNVAATPMIDVPDRSRTCPAVIAPNVRRVGPLVSSAATTVGFG